jgi:hypothetical protein
VWPHLVHSLTFTRPRCSHLSTCSAQSDATVIICRRKKIEYAPVEELRKPCRGREEEQANLTEGKNQSCPYTELFLSCQQATVTSGKIAVTEAR